MWAQKQSHKNETSPQDQSLNKRRFDHAPCGTEQGVDCFRHKPVTAEAPSSRKGEGKEKRETRASGDSQRPQNNL